MDKNIYAKCLRSGDFESIVEKFRDTIIDTNRGHKFFVDWRKVKKHVEKYKIELNILNSLIGSKDFDNELRYLLSKYPDIIPVIPILIAIRGDRLQVIKDFLDADSDIVEYNFKKRNLSSTEIEKFTEFFDKTGLKYFFQNLSTKNIQDYITGVEVGLDTHARKNRSGQAMELVLKPIIEEINLKYKNPFELIFQNLDI